MCHKAETFCLGDQVGGLLQQIWFWLPAFQSECRSPLQRRHSSESVWPAKVTLWLKFGTSLKPRIDIRQNCNWFGLWRSQMYWIKVATFCFSLLGLWPSISPLHRVVRYCLTNNKHFTFQADTLPEQLQSQKHIVELMANYMEQNLMEVRSFSENILKFISSANFTFNQLWVLSLHWKQMSHCGLN